MSSARYAGRSVLGRSSKAPSRLAELLTLAEAENRRGRDPVEERLTGADRVAETKPRALRCREVHPVLRLVGVGDLFELRCIADLDGASFDHDIETVETVLARGENALWVLPEVLCLTLRWTRAKVHRVVVPHGQQRRDVRASIGTHRRDPEHLRLIDVPSSLRPTCRGRPRAAEPCIELCNRHLDRHLRSL